MATSSSRVPMTNLKDRKSYDQPPLSNTYDFQTKSEQERGGSGTGLSIPEEDILEYQPSNTTFQSRTVTRILKGKFDRGISQEKEKVTNITSATGSHNSMEPQKSEHGTFARNRVDETQGTKIESASNFGTSITSHFTQKAPFSRPSGEGLKLVLPDQEDYTKEKEKKLTSLLQLSETKETVIPNKRINIQIKEEPKEPPKEVKSLKEVQKHPKAVQPPPSIEKKQQVLIEEIPIAQLKPEGNESEDTFIENDNELVECPEGCGRKFNKKALESHAKACKIIFMSKRKEFNSQAKRVTSKEQASLVKQAKKKDTATKLEKTGEAWKTQSEGFRAVIKALKQEQPQEGGEEKEVQLVTCEYCEKKFSQILISKHIPICEVKREREKKTSKKAPKK